MEGRVGGAAESHVRRHSVVDGLFGHDVAGADVLFEKFHDLHTRLFGKADTGGGHGGRRAVAGQGHAHGFAQAVHGVGGVHAGTGTAAGTGVFGQVFQLFFGHGAVTDRADAFKHADEVGVVPSRQHGTAAHDDGGQVQAHHGHEHTGDDLVAVGDEHQRVERMCRSHDFDGVGDDFPRGQGEAHTFMIHGQAVAHGDGRELHRRAARHADARLDGLGDFAEMQVAGDHFVGGVHHADERAFHLFAGQAERVEQGAMGGLFKTEGHFLAAHCLFPFKKSLYWAVRWRSVLKTENG